MKERSEWNNGLLLGGLILGIIIGGIVTLFRTPKSGDEVRKQITNESDNIRHKLEAAVVHDPVTESLAEGKAAARRRRLELGYKD